MATIATLQARVSALEEAIETVAAGRQAQWGDRMVTMVNMPELEAALHRAERQLAKKSGRKDHAVAVFK